MNFIKKELEDYKILLRSIPGLITTLFCLAVVVMNLMANKIIFNSKFMSVDGGILLSWIPFLCMDVITKRYGPKASSKMNILALIINLFFVGIFALVSSLQVEIGVEYQQGNVYESFNNVFSCTWFVLLSSSLAFVASGIINNITNWAINKRFKNNSNGVLAFTVSSYISTFIGQFLDNLIFAVMTFMIFAPIYWGYSLTLLQCIGSSLVGGVLELLMEIIFSPIGYKILKKWEKENIGIDYLTYRNSKESK